MTYPVTGMEGVETSSRLVEDFLRSFKNYAILYVLGIFTFLISFPISKFTGTKPDFGVVFGFVYYCGTLIGLIVALMLGWRLVRMVLVEKPDSPTRAMIQSLKEILSKDRIINIAHMLASISFFMIGFAVLKGAIAVLNPFEWDVTFRDWDKALHLGVLPHDLLGSLFFHPYSLFITNLLYNTWFVVMMGTLMLAGVYGRGFHMQYLVGFALTWLFGGFFLAVVFSSAGPAFYELAGYGDDYVPLMNTLYSAADVLPLWALSTQEMLWEGYTGERDESLGISAFPSMHVATTSLIAFYASRVNRFVAILAWAFLVSIMLGSVVLGWHYAVDGYAAFFLAMVFWKMAGVLTRPRGEVQQS